jgi:glycosyltransferase involved in cell wall biosynthesis
MTRILAIGHPNNGVHYHRIHLPLSLMPDVYVLFTDFINDEVLQRGFDVVLCNRFVHGCSAEQMAQYKTKYDFKLIVDIDDYWVLDPWHILYGNYPTQEIIKYIKIADTVTVTHDRLRNEVHQHNKSCEILPNALPYGTGQFAANKVSIEESGVDIPKDSLRVLYAGGVTHEQDIAIISNPFKRIASDSFLKSKLSFVLAGYDSSNKDVAAIWHRMISNYLCGFKLNGYVREPLPPDRYMAFYSEAEICIAPLISSRFNSMKSNLKTLEAAAFKLPILVSAVDPYLDSGGIKIWNQTDWFNWFKLLAKSKEAREDYGEINFAYSIKHHNFESINTQRKHIYES